MSHPDEDNNVFSRSLSGEDSEQSNNRRQNDDNNDTGTTNNSSDNNGTSASGEPFHNEFPASNARHAVMNALIHLARRHNTTVARSTGSNENGEIDTTSGSPLETLQVIVRENGAIVLSFPESNWSASVIVSSQQNNQRLDEDSELKETEEETVSTPRQHAYLPGICHPLFPEEWLHGAATRHGPSGGYEVPIFPRRNKSTARKKRRSKICGEVIDAKNHPSQQPEGHLNTFLSETYKDDSKDDYMIEGCKNSEDEMTDESDESETFNSETALTAEDSPAGPVVLPPFQAATNTMELPILELDDVVLFPGATLPLRLRNPQWVEYLGRRIDEARGLTIIGGSHSGAGTRQQLPREVRIGVVTSVKQSRRRRQLSNRPLFVPNFGGRERQSATDEREAERLGRTNNRVMGHWRMEMMRRGIRRRWNHELHPTSSFIAESAEEQSHTDNNDLRSETEASVNQNFGTINPDSQNNAQQNNRLYLHAPEVPVDRFDGRIGTFATITYTHEEDKGTNEDSRSRVFDRGDRSILIVKAIGTGRFRIKTRIGRAEDDRSANNPLRRAQGDMADIHLYVVEELLAENISLPPASVVGRRKWVCSMHDRHSEETAAMSDAGSDCDDDTTNVSLIAHDRLIHNLSAVSPIPAHVFRLAWPWRHVEAIVSEICAYPSYQGLRNSLPLSSGYQIITDGSSSGEILRKRLGLLSVDPIAFSFWMASNMPLSENDRVDLLETNCVVERLRFILDKLVHHRLADKPIRCKRCGSEVAKVSDMFTVGGAEGTTGAYVNEHGVIHQTITISKMIEGSVVCYGNAETRDSWFPGYSWTVAYCSICRSHLGWKFLVVQRRSQEVGGRSKDQPHMFWGISSTNVTTEATASPTRVIYGRVSLGIWNRDGGQNSNDS